MQEVYVNKFINSLFKADTQSRVARVTFWRHGDSLHDRLSDQGFQDAVKLGQEVALRPPNLINTSAWRRTLMSAQGFLEGIVNARSSLEYPEVNEMRQLSPPSLRRQEINSDNLFHWTSGLAHLINHYASKMEKVEDANYHWVVNFTHSVVIGNLLNCLIAWQTAYNFKSCFERIQFLKGCDFVTIMTKDGNTEHKLLCGGVVFKPDMQKLNQLVDRYNISPYCGVDEDRHH